MILHIVKELGVFILELIAIVLSLVILPTLMLALAVSCVGIGVGTLMEMNGHELGRSLLLGGSFLLVATLALGWVTDRLYGYLR